MVSVAKVAVPYIFYIEFVTTNRKVIKSFALGKYFFMFDS